jgi:hypothetical protein
MRSVARLAAAAGFAILPGQALAQQAVDDFVAGNGHARVELAPYLADYQARLTADAATTSLPDEGMGPLEKAALFVDAVEGELPITRWLYRLGQMTVEGSTGGEETLWFVDIARFNVGPAWRDMTAADYGEENTAPAEEFGVGPSVSWRLVFSPVMGMTADFIEAGRREWTDAEVEGAKCFGQPCLSTGNAIDGLGAWADETVEAAAQPLPYEPASAAKLINLAGHAHGFDIAGGRHSQWSAPEKPERVGGRADAFIGGLIETGIGQDPADEIAMVYAGLNDDAIKDIWKRAVLFGDATTHMGFTTPWR